MMIHPQFDPVALSLGPVEVHWYGLMYLLAFAAAYGLAWYRSSKRDGWTTDMVSDLVFFGALGVILGGRIGYVLFYQFGELLQNPAYLFRVWEGGMSFHGGFLGVLVAMWLFGRKHHIGFWKVADFVAPLVPLGLASGRIGNFINGELWGRVTDINAFWAMGFPQARYEDLTAAAHNPQWAAWLAQYGMLPRHPSQLYQFALEGVALFVIVWLFSKKPRPTGQVAMVFLAGYGFFRFIAEFARQPDDYLGLLTWGLSMGQWLSLPMVVLGIIGFIYFGKRGKAA